MELLSDNPITKESDDTFGFGFFVDILGKAILDTKYLPVTVGIFGEWGTGKTSLMRLLCKRLESNECKTIWFNPWKYDSKEELWAALIRYILLEIRNVTSIWKWNLKKTAWALLKENLFPVFFSFSSTSVLIIFINQC